jgi:hypothetical protein
MLLAALFSAGSMAESGNYRIEVLVFNHLDSAAEPRETDTIRSFSKYLTLDEPQPAAAPVRLEVMSSVMQDAWRRLRLSATYRPLLFASWEQTRIDYHPPVRLHDEEVIDQRLHFPRDMAFIDLRSPDPLAPYRVYYHRLDGTVQLRRSRFLHLDLDLEYRQDLLPRMPAATNPEPIQQPLMPIVVEDRSLSLNEIVLDGTAPLPGPGPALIHSLKQTRQIRTGDMQYFDTPFLGVLVRVTATTGL